MGEVKEKFYNWKEYMESLGMKMTPEAFNYITELEEQNGYMKGLLSIILKAKKCNLSEFIRNWIEEVLEDE